MSESDDKLLRRYRELSRDEPPAALDAAILAASRRAVGSRPWSQRFATPVSIAAVLMLAVGVTLNMQREEPGIESAVQMKPIPAEPAMVVEAPKPLLPEVAKADVPSATMQAPATTEKFKPDSLARESKPAKAKVYADNWLRKEIEQPPAAAVSKESRAFALAPPAEPPPPVAAAGAQSSASREKREAADANVVAGKMRDDVTLPDPAAELERIARLRTEGRHEDADKALEAFVRKNPDYRIPDPVWDRVRRR